MEEQKFSFTGSFQKTKEYADTQLELFKLRAIAKSARIGGALVLDVTKLLLSLIVVFFLSLALGFFLGELMDSNALGFLSTGILFLIVLFIVIAKEPKLEAKFMDLTIARILSKWNDEDDLDIDQKIKDAHFANKKKAEETKVQDFYEENISENENKN
ncbi:phage holin family protein [Sphingobacterium rhinopitheci]|uniref:phage holin family protein n=1 Tax=Sphingobacterium rhinopitheci TaxID=2781960 RepID=UPI001F5274EA|nr:phage holin family protein [Sphingobacterium rhinopitheci]MCI0921467.1 hypothetical protein [Sphingobacterium rhinopitheci]